MKFFNGKSLNDFVKDIKAESKNPVILQIYNCAIRTKEKGIHKITCAICDQSEKGRVKFQLEKKFVQHYLSYHINKKELDKEVQKYENKSYAKTISGKLEGTSKK